MKINRRRALGAGLAGGAAMAARPLSAFAQAEPDNPNYATLDAVLDQPVFRKELFPEPVIIRSVELLRHEGTFLCRVRSKDGAEGISVAHDTINLLYPIFLQRLQPVFVGQDARRLDELLEKALVYAFNFRFGGLAIGIPLATIEFAILDMMGRIAGKPAGELVGKIHNTHIPVYQATEWREKPVEESVALIRAAVEESRAQAVKIKVGGLMFMTKDLDARGPMGRTETIIPRIREVFGDQMALYADANGYYEDVGEAIRVGKLLEKYDYRYFEEPVYFDWLDGTRAVAQGLSIPIAGGEQQHSVYAFRWLLANGGLDVVQPDHYYFGGMIRSLQVARMAEAMGKQCIPHISGGFGFIYMLHLVSVMPNAGAHIEFKGYTDLPIECTTSSLRVEDGKIQVPTGPGIGVVIDPEYVKKFRVVEKS
ncbi:MAG: mandelate racemase/muconate lactonizing enzyme family protein [Thermoguttaceae bacterium]